MLGSCAWRIGLLALTIALTLGEGVVGRSWAQATGAGGANHAGPSNLSQAQSHFVLGMNFFGARNYREALYEFQLAAVLAPNADVWFNIARAYEELGEYSQAASAFERYLRDRVDAADAVKVQQHIARLQGLAAAARARNLGAPQPGSLRIHHLEEHARVFLDGQPLTAATLNAPLLLTAGRHRLDVVDSQYIPMHAVVGIEPGLLTAAYADLEPATQPHTRVPSHALSYVLFGVAGAAALVGATFGALSLAQQSDGALGSAQAWARRADVALAGTAVCALVAAIAYYGAERGARSELLRTRVTR